MQTIKQCVGEMCCFHSLIDITAHIRDLYAYVVMCVRNNVHAPSVLVIIALTR